jgi:4-hydroxybenzoate polyprenyltransferase
MLALTNQKTFFALLITLWIISAGLTLVIAFLYGKPAILPATIGIIGLIYSELRRIPMTPMILVATTSASPILFPVLLTNYNPIIWFLFIVVVLTILGREIIKDIEDVGIDKGYKWTLPVMIGPSKAGFVASALIVISGILLTQINIVLLPSILLGVCSIFWINQNTRLSKMILDTGIVLNLICLLFIY